MSKEMKVGDIFKLPMLCESGDGNLYSDNLRHVIVFDDSDTNCYEQKRVTSIALNNHDRLIEENAALKKAVTWHVSNTMKLYKENRKLREVLNDLTGIAIHCHAVGVKLQPYQLAEISDARKLLKELK